MIPRPGRMLVSMLAGILAGTPVLAQPVDDLQRDDSLVQTVAWRLMVANAPFCARNGPATDIVVQDIAAYADPALAARVYGLAGPIHIGALAENGPGAKAGLAVNQTLIAVDGQSVSTLPPPPQKSPFDRADAVQTMLDNAAARHGAVTLTLSDGRQITVPAGPACHVHVHVDDGKNYARATRDEVHLGRRHLAETQGDETLIAAMAAHEMAHAVLDHQAQMAASHGSLTVTRRAEREADRLSVWLLANAGYPPEAAVTYQSTIIARHAGFLTIDPTHGSWRTRIRVIAEEIAVMAAAPDRDWARRFRREEN